MWTPRRLLLLVAGFVALLLVFGVYNRFLGWIDGLPALPDKFLPSASRKLEPTEFTVDEPRMNRLLKQAFGESCVEKTYPIKLSIQAQEILLATDQVEIEPDGRLKVSPFSVAIFGKERPETGCPEINTVHCDVAYVTFDRKIETLSDMGRGKIVAAEFIGDKTILSNDPRKGSIRVVHNHATPQPDDDIVAILPGPVYFRDRVPGQKPEMPQLWTRSYVDITDHQSKPPHLVKAQGMNIYLNDGAVPTTDRPAPKATRPSGQAVKRIDLLNVNMKLALDDQSTFPSGERPATPGKRLTPDEKPILTVSTLGPFQYDLENDHASFEIAPQAGVEIPQSVEVIRSSKTGGNDVIQCDRLDLQFKRKTSARANEPPAADFGGALEIVEAKATGAVVVLTSDSEKLHARGTTLIFNQAQKSSILRGSPLTAFKDGNKLQASELELRHIDAATLKKATAEDPVRLAVAKGPGVATLADRENQRSVEVRWTQELRIDRWPAADRIHLTGGAAFEDRDHGQRLEGDQIKVWLSSQGALNAPIAAGAFDQSRTRPRQVRAIGNVRAVTPELKIDNTVLLDIWFQDTLPAAGQKPLAAAAPSRPSVIPTLSGTPVVPPAPGSTLPTPPQPTRKRVEVSAQTIEAIVRRDGSRNDLEKVVCRERVAVHQDATRPGERGLDVSCNDLTLTHTPEGDILELAAKRPALAKVESQQLMLYGNQIIFDQKENRAIVDGAGSMKMWSATTFSGDKRTNPVPMTVFWNDRMTFVGSIVSFQGGVQAVQENSKVLCPRLDVYLDRVVSLNRLQNDRAIDGSPRAKSGEDEQPRIVKVFCHNGGLSSAPPVTVTDVTYDTTGKLLRYQRIETPEVTFDNDQGIVATPGRGEVRMLQPGEKSSADPFGASSANATASADTEMKLIRIRFDDRMEINTKLKTAQFYRNIQTIFVPTDNPNLFLDENRLPPSAFALRCDRLLVESNQFNGQTFPSMKAEGHADIQSREFSGRADVIKYDEGRDKKQQVIFESTSRRSRRTHTD